MFKKIILFICIFAIGFVSFEFLKNKKGKYEYDVTADYQYNFDEKSAVISELTLSDGVISFASPLNNDQSSFLKVSVESNTLSLYNRPSLTISNGNMSEVQFFEHGAMGTRYLNVSKLLKNGTNELRIVGHNTSVLDGPVELIQYENVALAGKRILVLAPHPDDAEIGAFGLYNSQDDVYVVTVTAGDAGGFMYDEIYQDPVRHYLKKGQVRTWNSLTVPMLGGVMPDRTLNLGFFDSTLLAMAKDKSLVSESAYIGSADINMFRKENFSDLAKGLTEGSDWKSLVDNLAYVVGEIKPDIIVAPSPRLDNHSDHQYATHALIEAIKKLDKKDGHILLYTNHFILEEAWPYGDAGAVMSLPPAPTESNYFSSIYSHPMTKEEQQGKEMALDAMNDLRLGTDFRFFDLALINALKVLRAEIFDTDETYFRRAVRSNELFFVIKTEELYNEGVPERL